MEVQHEKRARQIARDVQTKAGTFAFAFWFTDFRLPGGAFVFATGGGKRKNPVQVWATYGQAKRNQSTLIATLKNTDPCTLYADMAAAIDREIANRQGALDNLSAMYKARQTA